MFDAPRELVWKCFTEPERMKQWWGPKGFKVIASKMDLRPGGTYHYGMKAPDGMPMWGKMVYREISPPDRIVFVNSFSDEAGGTTRHPLHKTLAAADAVDLHLRGAAGRQDQVHGPWAPLNATDEERKTFDGGHDSMRQGWGGTLEQLAAYLAKSKAKSVQSESPERARRSPQRQ